MKRKSFLLTLLAAVSALALMATPAEAGGKKKDRDRDWRDGDRRQGYLKEVGTVATVNIGPPIAIARSTIVRLVTTDPPIIVQLRYSCFRSGSVEWTRISCQLSVET